MLALVLASWLTGWSALVPAQIQVCPCAIPNCSNVAVPETTMVRVVFHTFAPGGLYSRPISQADTISVRQDSRIVYPGRWIGSPVGWNVAFSWVVIDASGNVSCSVDRSVKTTLNMQPGELK